MNRFQLKDARRDAGLSQSRVARAAGKPLVWLSEIERGDRECSEEQMCALVKLMIAISEARHQRLQETLRQCDPQREMPRRARRAA